MMKWSHTKLNSGKYYKGKSGLMKPYHEIDLVKMACARKTFLVLAVMMTEGRSETKR